MNKPIFIAEIKIQSPFGYQSEYTFHSLMNLAIQYGDWISVHTNPLWGGSFEAIEYVRRFTNKLILAKGIHSKDDDIKKAIDYGANYVLVVDRIPNIENVLKNRYKNKSLLIELGNNFSNLSPFSQIDQSYYYVYNGRDLSTGINKQYSNYQKYRDRYEWLCGASLINTPEDVERLYPRCDAFIVGENLVEFCTCLKDGRYY